MILLNRIKVRMYLNKSLLLLLALICTLTTLASKYEVELSGKIFEYQALKTEETNSLARNSKSKKGLEYVPVKKFDVYMYTDEGDFYKEVQSKNGSFKIDIPSKRIFNIFIYAEGFDNTIVQFNTENIEYNDEGDWQKYNQDFYLKSEIDYQTEPVNIQVLEWNATSAKFTSIDISIKDKEHVTFFKDLLKNDRMEAAAACTKLIDKYFNGNTEKNKLKEEEQVIHEIEKKYPIKMQMKRDLSKVKNTLEGLQLKKQIIEVEMEATDIKVAFTQDPEIDSILQLKRPQIQAYVNAISTEYDRFNSEYERMKSSLKAYLNAEKDKQGEPLTTALEAFYPDSMPAHFEEELLKLLDSFESAGEEVFDDDGDYSDKVIDNNPGLVKNKNYEAKLQHYIKDRYGEEAANNMSWESNEEYGSDKINYADSKSSMVSHMHPELVGSGNTNKTLIAEKYQAKMDKLNKDSKNNLEKVFFNKLGDNDSKEVSYEFDNQFESQFSTAFAEAFKAYFKTIFDIPLKDGFEAVFNENFKKNFDENVSPEEFKKSFARSFNKSFEEAYQSKYNSPISDEFALSFKRSFNSLFNNYPNMPFGQNFERAFTPSFEEAFKKAIPQINEALHGKQILSDLEAIYAKPEPIKRPTINTSTSAASSSPNDKNSVKLVTYNDQKKQHLSTKKRQSLTLKSTSIAGTVNPNQELFDNKSVDAFITKLKSTYNPAERYSFMIDTSEIIVTKYRTPEGVFEVLSDKKNRVQMLKNNLIITDNVFGEEQLEFYKGLEKLSNYDFKNDQIAKINYSTRAGLIFKIQVAAISKSDLKIFNPLKIYGGLTIDKQNLIYKYMIGEYHQLFELIETKAIIKQTVPDAFTVVYYHGQRIHMKHALQILLGNPKYIK